MIAAPGAVRTLPSNRTAKRTLPLAMIIKHSTRGQGAQGAQAGATINWFSDSRAFPRGSSHGSWGSSALAVIGVDPNEPLLTRFHSGSVLDVRPTWAAGYGGLGPRLEYGADELGASIEYAQSASQEPYRPEQYVAGGTWCAWIRADQRARGQDPVPLVRLGRWRQLRGQPIPRGFLGHEDTQNGVKLGKTDPGPLFDYDRLFAAVRGAERGAAEDVARGRVPAEAAAAAGSAEAAALAARVAALERVNAGARLDAIEGALKALARVG